MEASAAADDHGGHHQTKKSPAAAGGSCHGSDGRGGKSRADLYAGAVAQRALYGPTASRCREAGAARRQQVAGNKDWKQPSRLSKMSGAEGT